MLFFNRHIRSLPLEGWICNFEVVYWTRRCAIWPLWVWEWTVSLQATKVNAIVTGQTSVKAPEKEAFEAHLPKDVHILSCHSLHGPTVSPIGQPFVLYGTYWFTQVLIQHRTSKDALTLVENILRSFCSRSVYSSFDKHGSITANIQAVNPCCLPQVNHPWRFSAFYDWWKIIFPNGPIPWSVWVLLGLPQKHVCGNRASVLVSRLPNWTSHFGSIRMLGMSMQDSPFWIPVPVLKSNMPKVPRSCSNWCWLGVMAHWKIKFNWKSVCYGARWSVFGLGGTVIVDD